ncbi:MAG: response regulator [Gammaproteobacteria bacterium]|nr:response regulator [Gammaproteobacteria bacterium]|tara:strand:+ start:4579 stop:5910 length:1332 start_codon:yes stop_codon:yes gene_type:complete
MTDLLLIDAMRERSNALAESLTAQGIGVKAADTIDNLALGQFDCLVIQRDELPEDISNLTAQLPVIVLAPNGTIKDAVTAIQLGARDYLEHPITTDELLASIERACAYPPSQKSVAAHGMELIGSSENIQTLRKRIEKVGPSDSPILILGQSGTGKELVARALHAASRRARAPMITINCATVPENLIETELFGIEPFGHAQSGGNGLVEAAHGGTLFLDEIAELSLSAQAKLIQVVQGENRKVGSARSKTVDVRLIAATHRDLQALTESGDFRSDLFYRLNVLTFHLSPLQNRDDDILEIGEWLLKQASLRLDKKGLTLGHAAKETMVAYHWPGNVRELSNAIERAVILSDDHNEITPSLLAIEPILKQTEPQASSETEATQTSLEDYFVRFVQDHQDQLTETELAEKLGISRKSLWERRQRLNIPRKKTRKRGPRLDTGANN